MSVDVKQTKLPGVLIIDPVVHGDSRGFFLETWREDEYKDIGIKEHFVQSNHSRSELGVLRGLHMQRKNPQGKLVRVSRGSVFDVAADVNPASATFGQWVGVELNDENCRQFYVPPGYLHGFCVLSEIADFIYQCTSYYDAADECGVRWDDSDIDVDWPVAEPKLSQRDVQLPSLKQFVSDCF